MIASKNNIYYIFIFGASTVGKTNLIASLLLYLNKQDYGNFNTDNSDDETKKYIKELLESVNRKDMWLQSTNTGEKGAIEIKCSFIPHNKKLPQMNFVLLEMSGENLNVIKEDSDLPPKIYEYLSNDSYILNVIILASMDNISAYDELNKSFLEQIYKTGHRNNIPIAYLISKWDSYSGKNSHKVDKNFLDSHFKQSAKYLNSDGVNKNKLLISEYSLVDGNIIYSRIGKFNIKYPEKIFKWLYKENTGQELILKKNIIKSFLNHRVFTYLKILLFLLLFIYIIYVFDIIDKIKHSFNDDTKISTKEEIIKNPTILAGVYNGKYGIYSRGIIIFNITKIDSVSYNFQFKDKTQGITREKLDGKLSLVADTIEISFDSVFGKGYLIENSQKIILSSKENKWEFSKQKIK